MNKGRYFYILLYSIKITKNALTAGALRAEARQLSPRSRKSTSRQIIPRVNAE
ncbi:hypothetical protein QFZ81_005829 [Paenibacillus sp. V4I9]|nr:hypothetical protein [Paenibacillus sp. V4I9]